jgi:hypothetical protein
MNDPRERKDFSRFLVHLTRNTRGIKAEENLINMLDHRKIEARNFHCLFGPKIKKMELTKKLKKSFKTVCFTETPLDQIFKLTVEDFPRRIKLRPYGLVFWRDVLLEKGANPAIYINGDGTNLNKYLINEFDRHFKNISALKGLKNNQEYYQEIVHYYSLINLISDRYDFSWEREWRCNGDFKFKYRDIVTIISDSPETFLEKCHKNLTKNKMNYINRIPIISSRWGYERVIDEMSEKLWNMRPNK